ncbi:ZBED6 C-terminal-like protein [Choloepus didactylus]|uniref:ZBED6 C-terminal-like protein n=1 Tax=Choloepus didactylus TaxID=27675 RepID=UPI00189FD117|nr:ZBED6 C-terminal-like protein [Choloepus didactylus]XP_037691785.1 ZBED6 C-terminal-like protein [Choloepus didactylus]
MLKVEKIKKPSKRQTHSGSGELEPCVCADSPMTRSKSPAATLASPCPEFNTRATNTPRGLGWGTREDISGTEVKLEFVDKEKKAGSGHKKKMIRSCSSQMESERDLSLQKGSPCLLPSCQSVPLPGLDQVFLKKQEGDALSLPSCNEKRKASPLGRPDLHPALSHAALSSLPKASQASPGQNKLNGDSGICGLQCMLGQQHPLQHEKKKKASKQKKSPGWREEGKQSGKKLRSPPFSSGQASSSLVLVQTLPQFPQVTSPGKCQGNQANENEEERQADILIAHVARELRRLKKCKKKHLLPGMGKKLGPQLSQQKPPCLKKLIKSVKPKTKGLDSQWPTPGPLDTTGQKPTSDIRQFFAIDYKNACHVTCTLCHASIRWGKIKERLQTSELVCHLASKHRLEWEKRQTTASQGKKVRGAEEKKQKGLPKEISSVAPAGLPSPRCDSDPFLFEDSDGEQTLGRREQLFLVPASLPTATKDKPAPCKEVRKDSGSSYASKQPRAQTWNHSIAELLCSMALPFSFVSSQPFRRFMAQVDPCYHLPLPVFFSDKALPLLHEAVGEQVLQEMQWAEGNRVHFTTSISTQDSAVDYVVIAAHWGLIKSGGRRVASGSLRKQAVLWVQALPVERTPEDRQLELVEQINLWLSRSSLRPGFLVSGGWPNLERTLKREGYTHIPCFAHYLDNLVRNFLCHHHSAQIILGTARAICGHFQGSAEARRLLTQLQHQCGLTAQQPFQEISDHWISAYHLMEWLVEQQQPLQEYEKKHQLGKAGTALSAMFWSLTDSLVKLLQPFQMVALETSSAQASLSQVLPQLRYLHIFLEQVHGHFVEQSAGEMGTAVRLAEGLALHLSTDPPINEFFHREEFVLATLLDPRFKGKIEAILPLGADIDHWKQVLVYKVKEIMVSECSLSASSSLQSQNIQKPKDILVDAALSGGIARNPRTKGKSQKEPLQKRSSGSFPLIQKEKSLLEQLESVGLLASEKSGASLSTENHLASIIVQKYLCENETVGAQEDPLAYWEKKCEVWPALARLAILYLSCPPTGAFSKSIFASLNSPTIREQNSPLKAETVEHLLFLKTNLENFPNYTPPPLVFSSSDLTQEEKQTI